MVENKNYPPI